jgi:hypothetical protein
MKIRFLYFVGRLLKINNLMMLRNPAGERNKQPILETLQQYINPDVSAKFLEISSGN